MASPLSGQTPKPAASKGPDSSARFVEYNRYIDSQLQKTRLQVRNVDIAGALMTLGAGSLAFFLVLALLDHWVVPGGLSTFGRWLALGVYLSAVVVYAWRSLLPLLLRRINPVYAAHSIERSKPTLKNSLINFLLLRANPAGLTQNVFHAIEEQAATSLSQVPVEASVDRSKLVKLGYVLMAVLLLSAVYKVVSPKDPLKTFGRVVLPWANIDPPTRVTIVDVKPRDATVFRGQQVPIVVEVQGLSGPQNVTLFYSSDDGQVENRALPLRATAEGYLYEAELPDSKGGIQQDLVYRIEAGDAVSRNFRLKVQAAPTIVVESVDYAYPEYTGMLRQTVEHLGDIKGIEGTQVTIRAIANQPIKSADLDFDCDGTHDQRMRFDDREAIVSFTLALKEDRKTPEHSSYRLKFTDTSGQENLQPIRHQIEVTPDVAPEIAIVAPRKDEIDIPLGAALRCQVVANDPDYSLRRVGVAASLGGKPLFEKLLLDEPRVGQFGGKQRISPKKLGLKAGDVIEYWGWAEDSKSPRSNRTETLHYRARIVSPSEQTAADDRLAQNSDLEPENRNPDSKQAGKANDQTADPQQTPDPQQKPDQEQPSDQNAQGGDSQQSKSEQAQQGQGEPQSGKQGGGAGDEQQGQSGKNERPGDQGDESAEPKAGDSQSGDAEKQDTGQGDSGKGEAGKNDAGQPGDKAGDGQPQQQLAKDGSDDGKAIQQVLDQQKQQGDQPKPGDQQQPGGKNPGAGEKKEANSPPKKDGKPQAGEQSQAGGSDQGGRNEQSQPQEGGNQEKPDNKQQPGAGEQGQGGSEQGQPNQAPAGQAGGDQQSGDDANAGDGDNAQQGHLNSGRSKPKSGAGGEGDQPGGQSTGEKAQGKGSQTGDAQQPDPDRKSDGDNADGQHEEGGQAGEKSQGTKPSGERGKPAGAGRKSERGQAEAGQKPDGQKGEPGQSDERTGEEVREGAKGQDASGQGARSKGPTQKKPKDKPSGQKPIPDAKGGNGEDDKGDSGAGQSTAADKQGSPEQQGNNRQRNDKTQGAPKNSDQNPNDNGASPSISERQSDSQGDQEGDRSGGGKRGGGQKANKPGTGGAGQNTASDEGAGTAQERGQGDTSDRAGADQEAAGETGQSGDKAGQGSSSRKGEGQQPGGGKNPQGAGGQQPQPKGDPPQGENNGGNPGEGSRGLPGGAGQSQPTDVQPPPAAPIARGEDANLEYARKSTELVIQKLRDQLDKGQVDPALEKQGWTQQDQEALVRRYEDLFRKAHSRGAAGEAGKAELDASLRSLGLRPKGAQLKSGVRDDDSHGLKEGRRTRPPAEYLEQYRAYTQGTSRAKARPATEKPADR